MSIPDYMPLILIMQFKLLRQGWDNFSFRTNITGDSVDLWASIKKTFGEVRMHGEQISLMTLLTNDRVFSVKYLYVFLVKTNIGFTHKFLWKIKIPAKIKMFFWLLAHKSILTKDN